MPEWLLYTTEVAQHTVVGEVRVLRGVYSPQIGNRRDLYVYLPPSYHHSDQLYPVIYMHDGQNLFDAGLSYAGEWHVDETMESLSQEGLEAIVVGIANAGGARMREYNPYHHPQFGGGQGDLYLYFVVETIKPLIDADFRARPDRDSTTIIGSSMGGLISLYAFFTFPEVFGRAGVMSPSLWVASDSIYAMVSAAPHVGGRIYLDVGTQEVGSARNSLVGSYQSRRYVQAVRRMAKLLRQKGYYDRQALLYVEERGGIHNEADWARRLPDALRFLLRP